MIDIRDGDDLNPIFTQEIYKTEILEDYPITVRPIIFFDFPTYIEKLQFLVDSLLFKNDQVVIFETILLVHLRRKLFHYSTENLNIPYCKFNPFPLLGCLKKLYKK